MQCLLWISSFLLQSRLITTSPRSLARFKNKNHPTFYCGHFFSNSRLLIGRRHTPSRVARIIKSARTHFRATSSPFRHAFCSKNTSMILFYERGEFHLIFESRLDRGSDVVTAILVFSSRQVYFLSLLLFLDDYSLYKITMQFYLSKTTICKQLFLHFIISKTSQKHFTISKLTILI